MGLSVYLELSKVKTKACKAVTTSAMESKKPKFEILRGYTSVVLLKNV
jgi:hypothetical protein